MRVLHTSNEVKAAIRAVFNNAGRRRVAIVAFVGKDASAYLPKPKGLELYCWPQPGSTIASAIRGLQRRGVKVYFAARAHMKVYWSSGGKAVIGSANLSGNSLGVDGLHEVAVEVPSKTVRIDALIRRIKAKPATEASIAKLAKADKARTGGAGRGQRTSSVPSFSDWWRSERQRRWKWGYFEDYGPSISQRAKEAVRQIDAKRSPEVIVYGKRGQFRAGDWILLVKLSETGLITTPEWVYTHVVVLVERNDRQYVDSYPYQAVQAYPSRACPEPPFQIDGKFRQAVREAARDFGLDKMAQQVEGRPTPAFLNYLYKHYK